MSKILPRLGESACAAIARGNPTVAQTAELLNAVNTLDAGDRQAWSDISVKAMVAEVQQTAAPTLDTAAATEALTRFENTLTSDERDSGSATLGNTATDSQACLAIKTLYAEVPRRPEPDAGLLLRALVSQ